MCVGDSKKHKDSGVKAHTVLRTLQFNKKISMQLKEERN